MYTAHAEDTDMDTHVEESNTVMTATLTLETMDTHATEITMDMTVVPTCTLTAMEMTSHHQASEYTAHAEDTDTDTHQAPQVVMDSTCTTTITVMIAVTTVEYMDT